MLSSGGRRLGGLLLALVLFPGVAHAQLPPRFPDQLGEKLKAGQTAVVADSRGLQIVGKVAELSSTSLVIVTREAGRNVFAASDVMTIKRAGPIWDGAIKGATVGGLLPTVFLQSCYHCVGPSFFMATAGIGAAIGLGIDAAFGPKTVYRSDQQTRRIAIAPVVGTDRRGVLASIRF
jgi:hypothetical protein